MWYSNSRRNKRVTPVPRLALYLYYNYLIAPDCDFYGDVNKVQVPVPGLLFVQRVCLNRIIINLNVAVQAVTVVKCKAAPRMGDMLRQSSSLQDSLFTPSFSCTINMLLSVSRPFKNTGVRHLQG